MALSEYLDLYNEGLTEGEGTAKCLFIDVAMDASFSELLISKSYPF